MRTIIQDIRHSLRLFRKKPTFTAVVLLTISIGVGANIAIFSIVRSVLIRPLPYKEPDRIVTLWENIPHLGLNRSLVSFPDFLDWRERSRSFEYISGYGWNPYTLTNGGEPEQVRGVLVASNFFQVFGVEAHLGRTFLPAEEREPVVVLSYELWQRRFGSNPNAVGQLLTMSGQGYLIVGVMPPSFTFPSKDYQLWTTFGSIWGAGLGRERRFIRGVARLNPGGTFAQAQSEMSGIAANLEREYPNSNSGVGANVVTLEETVVGKDIRLAILILMGVVGFLLMIACANIANIQLAHTAMREREIAIRTALGASRKRVIRQLLTESILLSLIGGGLGLLIAVWGVNILVGLNPGNIPRLDAVELDGWLLGFAILLSIITGVIFGLAPALYASRSDLNVSLKEGGRGLSGSARGRFIQNFLVIGEIALSLVLLIGAGLMGRSFVKLLNVDLGFNPANVLTVNVNLSGTKYSQPAQQMNFFKGVVEKIESLPGVEAVAMCNGRPPDTVLQNTSFEIMGATVKAEGQEQMAADLPISPNFFRVMGVQLVKGREFTESDVESAQPVVIINEKIARQFLRNEDPIGKKLKPGGDKWYTIVGVVRDVKFEGFAEDAGYTMYYPYAQHPMAGMYLTVRSKADPQLLLGQVRRKVAEMDSEQPISQSATMDQLVSEQVAMPRFNTVLVGAFAVIGLLLAIVGTYGVISFSVSNRTREIAIRMALGAQQRDILKMTLGNGMKIVLIGIAIGMVAALAVTRIISNLLFDVVATDPITFVSMPLLLILVALIACYMPARRATKVTPIIALHEN
jgi:putative ABC transport system permease protein